MMYQGLEISHIIRVFGVIARDHQLNGFREIADSLEHYMDALLPGQSPYVA